MLPFVQEWIVKSTGARQKDEPGFSVSDELTLLEQIWMEKLSPLAPRGYN